MSTHWDTHECPNVFPRSVNAASLLGKGGTTDFQVRQWGIRRTRKSVVPLNQQPGERGISVGRSLTHRIVKLSPRERKGTTINPQPLGLLPPELPFLALVQCLRGDPLKCFSHFGIVGVRKIRTLYHQDGTAFLDGIDPRLGSVRSAMTKRAR